MEAINAANCWYIMDFSLPFFTVVVYSDALVREPPNSFTVYAAERPDIDVLFYSEFE